MKNYLIMGAILAGCIGGGLGAANLIEAFADYKVLITAGGTFIGVVLAFLVNKANTKKTS